MKKIFNMLLVAGVILSAVAAFGYTVEMNRKSGYYSGSGGEFSAMPVDFGWVLANYDSNAKVMINNSTYFQSFCIEKNEYVVPGTYFADFEINARLGGVGGKSGTPPNTFDPVSIGTAYLYYNFAKGNLSGYDYTPGAGRQGSAVLLQEAIWWLEDEISLANPGSNAFLSLAMNALNKGSYSDLKADSGGAYGVMALNIWNNKDKPYDYGEPDQSQLVLVPEPASLLLLGVGLLGLGLVARRRIK